MAESESSELLDVSPYEGGNMLNSEIFRTTDIRWISANLDMREGKAFWQQSYLERGPCRFWFHVPSEEERDDVMDILEQLNLITQIHDTLLLPKAGKMTWLNTIVDDWDESYFLTRTPNSNWTANVFHPTAEWSEMLQMAIKNAISVRWFRNTPIVPTTSWERLPSWVYTRLPHEYQEVEYIESSWTQYIDTEINLWSNNFKIDCDFSIVSWSSYEQAIASIWTSTYSYWNLFIHTDKKLDLYLNWHNYIDSTLSLDTKYNTTIERANNSWTFTLDNSSNVVSYTPWSTNETTLKLFTRWDVPWQSSSDSRIKMYYCKVYVAWTLTRDLVPCYRVSDWAIWLYDLVEWKFYTNAWTWTFTKWTSVNIWQMPEGYTELQYIQSDGNQVIKTEVYLDKAWYRANLEYQSLATSPADQAMFWLYYQWDDYAYRCWYWTDNTNWFTLSSWWTSLDKQTAIWWRTTLVRATYQFYLFAKQRYDDWRSDCWITWRLYNCQIYDNDDKFVRDFVPCIRDSDGVLWLYDLVSKQFFVNSWTGDFVAGPVVYRDIEEYVLLSNWWDVNKYSELTRYGTQSVRNNTTNWLWYAEQTDTRWTHYKEFTKEIVWFEVVQQTTNNSYDHVEFQLAPTAAFTSGNMPSLDHCFGFSQNCKEYQWNASWRVGSSYDGTRYLLEDKSDATATITWTWRKVNWVWEVSCVTSNSQSWSFTASWVAPLYVVWFKAWRWGTWNCWYWISAKLFLK